MKFNIEDSCVALNHLLCLVPVVMIL